jgi:hypothetical protein
MRRVHDSAFARNQGKGVVRMPDDLELEEQGLLECHRLGGDDVHQRPEESVAEVEKKTA